MFYLPMIPSEIQPGIVRKWKMCYIFTDIFIKAINIKGLVHFQIKMSWSFTHPHVIQDVYVFLSSVEKKLRFLMKTFQDFYPHSNFPNGWRSKLQFQCIFKGTINDTRRWIRVLYSETIGHLKKMYMLHKHKRSPVLWCAFMMSCNT